MDGDGLIHAGAQVVQRAGDGKEGVDVGEQQAAVHFFGKGIGLFAELLQIGNAGQAVAADGLQADHEALVVHAGNRLGDLEAVVHGAAGDAEAVAAGKARHGVQFLRLFQGNVAKVVEAAVEPGQLLFGQILQIEQQLAFGRLLGLRGRSSRHGLEVESGGFGGRLGLQYRLGRRAVGCRRGVASASAAGACCWPSRTEWVWLSISASLSAWPNWARMESRYFFS